MVRIKQEPVKKRSASAPPRQPIINRRAAAKRLTTALSRSGESTTADYEEIKMMIEYFPDLARQRLYQTQSRDGHIVSELPIFALCSKRIGSTWTEHMELVTLLYTKFPGAVSRPSPNTGMLPLHAVCDNSLHPRIIMFILKKNKKAANIKDARGGWPPLAYYVLQPDPHKTIVKNLVNAAPSTIEFEYDYDLDDQIQMPGPLSIAFSRDWNVDREVLELLIPTNPKSKCLKIEHPHGHFAKTISPDQSELLASGVYGWIEMLQLDTKWFSRKGLEAFFSSLASYGPTKLKLLDIMVSNNSFADSNVRATFSNLVQSTNLTDIRVRKPRDGSGPNNDDAIFDALGDGLHEDHTIENMGVCGVRGRSLSSLASILSNCRKFAALALTFVTLTSEGVESLIRGINESSSLKLVMLAPCEMPSGGLDRVLQALANSPSVKELTLELTPSDKLPSLRHLTNLSHLSIETNDENRLPHYDSACSVLDLLETSANLEELHVNGVDMEASRITNILKRNSTLKTLKLFNCSKVNTMARAVGKALSDANGTLTTVEVKGTKERLPSPALNQQLTYYTELNKVGRARVMNEDTANVSDLVQILMEVNAADADLLGTTGVPRPVRVARKEVSCALRYGILRELPSLWSGHYVGAEEATLVGAVAGLSLGGS